MTAPVLQAHDIAVSFGGVRAVDGVSLVVEEHSVMGLIGPNGSGKTSLMNALSGVVVASGRLEVARTRVPLNRPERIRAAGVVRTFQSPQVFAGLTCAENAMLSPPSRRATGVAAAWIARPLLGKHEARRRAAAEGALSLVGLERHADTEAGALTYGQQRLLELARALAGRPRVLLLDEPSAGLNDDETKELGRVLKEAQAAGTAMLLVDHKVDFIDALCQRLIVLELGRGIAEGTPGEVWADTRVRNAYLGSGPHA